MSKKLTIDDICRELRQQIVDRVIPPGTKLTENILCKKWNVSRTPVREALRRLESEGLLTSQRYKGLVVNSITIEDIDQLYTIRICLEGLAGRLATPIISQDPNGLRFLERLCKEMEVLSKKNNTEGYIKKNNEFHSYIWHSCGNKWLIKILENISSQVKRFIVKALYVPRRMEKSVQEHWEIYEKLKALDARSVEEAIGNNHRRALEDLKRELVTRI
jgi:DNA-binding GntR family transcriptional regulator